MIDEKTITIEEICNMETNFHELLKEIPLTQKQFIELEEAFIRIAKLARSLNM